MTRHMKKIIFSAIALMVLFTLLSVYAQDSPAGIVGHGANHIWVSIVGQEDMPLQQAIDEDHLGKEPIAGDGIIVSDYVVSANISYLNQTFISRNEEQDNGLTFEDWPETIVCTFTLNDISWQNTDHPLITRGWSRFNQNDELVEILRLNSITPPYNNNGKLYIYTSSSFDNEYLGALRNENDLTDYIYNYGTPFLANSFITYKEDGSYHVSYHSTVIRPSFSPRGSDYIEMNTYRLSDCNANIRDVQTLS